MGEWVAPKQYARWQPPRVDVKGMVAAKRDAESRYRKMTKDKAKAKPLKGDLTRVPPGREARPHGGKAGEIGPAPVRTEKSETSAPEPSAPESGDRATPRNVGEPVVMRESLAALVQAHQTQQRNLEGVRRMMIEGPALGTVISEGRQWEPLRKDMTIHTGELVADESRTRPLDMGARSVGPGRARLAVGTTSDKAATGPIRLSDTREFPKSASDSTREFRLAKGITKGAEPFGQMSLFDVPRDREAHNLLSAREAHTERIAKIPAGMAPGRQVASFAARPYFPKGEDQGSLLQPRKYR